MTLETTTGTPNNFGGYDNDFIDVPSVDRLVCKICHLPARDPYLSVCCGHLFCKSCLDNASTITNICPMCCNENFIHFLIRQFNEKLRSFTYTILTRGKVVSGRVN